MVLLLLEIAALLLKGHHEYLARKVQLTLFLPKQNYQRFLSYLFLQLLLKMNVAYDYV